MAHQKGSNVKYVIGVESTFGTAPGAGFEMPIMTCDLKPDQAIHKSTVLKPGRNPRQPSRGYKNVGGSIVVPVDSVAFWFWFQLMFGDPVTTGTGPYTHAFKIPASQPSFTVEEQMLDLGTVRYLQYLGCKISSFSLGIGEDGELAATLGVVGSNFNDAPASFDASPTVITENVVELVNAAVQEGGATLSNSRRFEFNLNMDLDTDQYVIGGGGIRGSIPEGVVEVSGSVTTLFEDNSLLTKAINGTESSFKLTITESADAVFELEIQELQYGLSAPAIDGPKGLLVALNYQGYYADGSEASAIVARLTNNDAH